MEEETNNKPLTDPWAMPEFTNSIILADGTRFPGHAALNDDAGDLWVWLDEGTDMVIAFSAFMDSEKTKKIISRTSILLTEEWEGYTKMTMIKQDGKRISIRMRAT